MVRGIVVYGALAWAGNAAAEDASSQVEHSTTLYLSSTWTPGPTVPVRIGAEGAVRVNRRKLATEARLGLGGAASLTALGSELHGRAGVSVGAALPAGKRVVFTPMLAYDVFGLWEKEGGSFAVHYVTFEIPVSIVFDRVVLEPFVQLGLARFHGATDPVVIIGPRIGLVL